MTTTGVHVHRAERADVLADALADVLARPLADPFAAEVVAVPAKGVERWLAQRLSHHLGAPGGDGVCAGVAFCSPAAIVADAVAAARLGAGGAHEAHEDPWRPERAVWPLLEVLDAAVDEPWCAPLSAHRSRRHALARRVAELFSAYATHRPELLRGWAAGVN
nr:exodeoxyribonuclease V subunit gamma [Pseudonocardiales bacterium]